MFFANITYKIYALSSCCAFFIYDFRHLGILLGMAGQGRIIGANENTLKSGAILALLLQVLLLTGAIVFYKERCLFIDTPHGLFNMINDNAFQAAAFRSFTTSCTFVGYYDVVFRFMLFVVYCGHCIVGI